MEATLRKVLILLAAGVLAAGCMVNNNDPPVKRVPPPRPDGTPSSPPPTARREYEPVKPMPGEAPPPAARGGLPQPFEDAPLLVDAVPETVRFVEAYNAVNRPRIAVWVNRTHDGQPIAAEDARLGKIDFEMIENLLADWMSADGRVRIVSPLHVRRALSPEQMQAAEGGAPRAMPELARLLDCHIIIRVLAQPTQQAGGTATLRLVSEAVDILSGESIARAAADAPSPLHKRQIAESTRFLARKLMDGMTQAWTTASPRRINTNAQERPAVEPAPPAPLRPGSRPGTGPAAESR